MSTTRSWNDYVKTWSPEYRARIEAGVQLLLARTPGHELRQARALVQHDVAARLGLQPPNDDAEAANLHLPKVDKFEQNVDAYLASLRKHVEAMGGSLKVVAEFEHGAVPIESFADIGDRHEEPDDDEVDAEVEAMFGPLEEEAPEQPRAESA